MKTAISIPDHLFERAEQFSKEHHINRSALFSQAIAEFIDTHRSDGVTDQLNKIYSQKKSPLDPLLVKLLEKSLPQENWS